MAAEGAAGGELRALEEDGEGVEVDIFMYFFFFFFFTFWNGVMSTMVMTSFANLLQARSRGACAQMVLTLCLPHVFVGLVIPFAVLPTPWWYGFVLMWPYYANGVLVLRGLGPRLTRDVSFDSDGPLGDADPEEQRYLAMLVEGITAGKLTDELYARAKRIASGELDEPDAEGEPLAEGPVTQLKRMHSSIGDNLRAATTVAHVEPSAVSNTGVPRVISRQALPGRIVGVGVGREQSTLSAESEPQPEMEEPPGPVSR
jgi:hypothetical protein